MQKQKLGKLINANLHWYNQQAMLHHQGTLSMTWVQYVAKLQPNQWKQLLHSDSSISLQTYQRILKLLQKTENEVLGKTYQAPQRVAPETSKSKSSLSKAKQNTQRLLAHLNNQPKAKRTPNYRRKITQIKSQKRKGRYNVYINNRYAFPISERALVRYRLKVGIGISKPLEKEITHVSNFDKVYNRALKYMDKRLRTVHETLVKLQRYQTSPQLIQEVIHRLERNGLLDDNHYANAYVRTKNLSKGPMRIKPYLRYKGVPEKIINSALKKSYPRSKQLQTAKQIAKDLFKSKQSQPFRQRVEKIKISLASKGFPFGLANEAISECNFKPDINQQNRLLDRYTREALRRYNRGKNHYKNIMKAKRYLFRKGFSFDDINSAIDKYDKT